MSKFNLNNIKKSLEMSKSFTLMDNFFNKKNPHSKATSKKCEKIPTISSQLRGTYSIKIDARHSQYSNWFDGRGKIENS